MNKIDFRKILPHLIAIAVFLIVAVVYCKPALEGKVVQQRDIRAWKGMAQQSMEYMEKHGHYPLWTNSMFSGMPAYQIAFDPRTPISIGRVDSVLTLWLPQPINFFFLACLGFYILCLVAGANPWVSIMGALAYAYSTYDPIIVSVGHNTKMASLGYAPMVLAGLLILFRRKYLIGFALTALFAALLIQQNHLQIVYYTLLMAVFVTLAFLVYSFRQKEMIPGIKATVLGLVAGLLGLATTAVSNMPTYEYAKESMRGGRSELTLNNNSSNKTKGGLDKDYAFRWSYGLMETFTFIVPGLYGGSNGNAREHNESSKFVTALSERGVPEEQGVQMVNAYSYWGPQSLGTSGPVYLGAIICFLFIFGLIYLKSWHKWWLIAATIVGIVLAWGANLKGINYFLFDYLPFYNKFRAPTQSLVIPQLCFPLLGVLALTQLIKETNWDHAWKKLRLSVFVTGGILIILAGFYFTSGFTGSGDKEIKENFKQSILQQIPAGQQPTPDQIQQADDFGRQLISALHEDRKSEMGGDLLRSLLLIAAAVALTGLFIKKKIKPWMLIAGLSILSTFDLLSIASRYLDSSHYVDEADFASAFTPSDADQQISADPDHANFRVFDQAAQEGPFQDSRTSYHHNSVGGYHPAKLGLYQDIIEHQLSKGNIQVYNMLNTKYFIAQDPGTGRSIAQQNPAAFGNCWLVKGIKWVNNANEEMLALDSTNLKDTVVIDKSYQSQVKEQPQFDSTASIKMKENLNDIITYTYKAASPQYAVFSEIYYSAGWNAFIDGKKTDYAKVDYVLRGLSLPAGSYDIEFRFEPASFTTGRTISIWSNILVMLFLLAAIILIGKHYLRR